MHRLSMKKQSQDISCLVSANSQVRAHFIVIDRTRLYLKYRVDFVPVKLVMEVLMAMQTACR